ncbi:hypothetical protein ACMGE6_01975 [Macrococcus equi]|uniref:hypothetical protein n=1 Tax=Macrococcus equi TaxID=3395462 RepID=UPI0039BDFCFC
MKKLALSVLSIGLLLPSLPAFAEVKTSKPSEIKVGNRDYSAVMLKDTNVMIKDTYIRSNNYFKTLKAGTKVVVVKHKLIDGYNFLVLKGNYYLPVDDSNLKIIGKSNTAIDYDRTFSWLAEQRLKEAKGKKYYTEYRQYIVNRDRYFKTWANNKEETLILTLVGGTGALTQEANGILKYADWLAGGKSTGDKPRFDKEDTANIDFTSKGFIKDYVNSTDNIVRGHKAGELAGKVNNDFRAYQTMVTNIGEYKVGNNAGYQGYKVAKNLIYAPKKPVSYYAIKKAYGIPASSELSRKHIVEHTLKYDKSKYGYDLYVVFDSYKGNLKYMYKKPLKK